MPPPVRGTPPKLPSPLTARASAGSNVGESLNKRLGSSMRLGSSTSARHGGPGLQIPVPVMIGGPKEFDRKGQVVGRQYEINFSEPK